MCHMHTWLSGVGLLRGPVLSESRERPRMASWETSCHGVKQLRSLGSRQQSGLPDCIQHPSPRVSTAHSLLSFQPQHSHLVIQQLLGHLDANSKSAATVRAGIVEVLSEAAVIAASGSVGKQGARSSEPQIMAVGCPHASGRDQDLVSHFYPPPHSFFQWERKRSMRDLVSGGEASGTIF